MSRNLSLLAGFQVTINGRFWVTAEAQGDFPNLNGVFARPIRWDLAEKQCDEMIRATVALKDGTAPAEAILKRFNSYNRSHPTYKALVEVGKAEKTILLCDYLGSQDLQSEVNDGLQIVENWNVTNEFISYGQRGELTTNSREEQEISVLSLQLLQKLPDADQQHPRATESLESIETRGFPRCHSTLL